MVLLLPTIWNVEQILVLKYLFCSLDTIFFTLLEEGHVKNRTFCSNCDYNNCVSSVSSVSNSIARVFTVMKKDEERFFNVQVKGLFSCD